jgi:hypothetical protein
MYQNSFETDVMDDLSFDHAEGPSMGRQAFDDFGEEYDSYEEDGADDEFIGGLIRGVGQLVGGAASADEFDENGEGFEEADLDESFDAYDEMDGFDHYEDGDGYATDGYEAFSDAVADALDAEDSEEFMRLIRRAARGISQVARRAAPVLRQVGRTVGQVARTVAPIASAIPLPQAQAIGRIANVAGRLLADGADEFEALDTMIDMAEEYDAIDAAAPMIAGLALRAAAPRVVAAARPVRRQAVQAVTRSVQTLAQRQGAPAARAAVRVAQSVGRRPIPARAVAPTVRRVTPQVARRPAQVRQLSRPLSPAGAAGQRRPGQRLRRPGSPIGAARRTQPGLRMGAAIQGPARLGGGGGSCPNCGHTRRFRLRGPVTLTIQNG